MWSYEDPCKPRGSSFRGQRQAVSVAPPRTASHARSRSHLGRIVERTVRLRGLGRVTFRRCREASTTPTRAPANLRAGGRAVAGSNPVSPTRRKACKTFPFRRKRPPRMKPDGAQFLGAAGSSGPVGARPSLRAELRLGSRQLVVTSAVAYACRRLGRGGGRAVAAGQRIGRERCDVLEPDGAVSASSSHTHASTADSRKRRYRPSRTCGIRPARVCAHTHWVLTPSRWAISSAVSSRSTTGASREEQLGSSLGNLGAADVHVLARSEARKLRHRTGTARFGPGLAG
jgi:hypothetical protein